MADPSQFGWIKSDKGWIPFWTDLLSAPIAMKNNLIKCQCLVKCGGRCSCFKAGLPCTALCRCGGKHQE